MKGLKTRYYSSFDQDFVETRDQSCRVPPDYRWVRRDLPFRLLSALVYSIAIAFSAVYCRLFLHIRFENSKAIKEGRKTGAFIYCNHTQPLGDVFTPALPCLPGRIYTVVSPANLAIPVIGKILPYLGALPIPDTLKGMKEFTAAIEYRVNQGKYVTIYPEAHVWEYYTGIRPFPETSFKYPAKLGKPVYSMTSTYQQRRHGKRPRCTVYIDGPFYPDTSLSPKERAVNLRNQVYERMVQRSKASNCQYIPYIEKPEEGSPCTES